MYIYVHLHLHTYKHAYIQFDIATNFQKSHVSGPKNFISGPFKSLDCVTALQISTGNSSLLIIKKKKRGEMLS